MTSYSSQAYHTLSWPVIILFLINKIILYFPVSITTAHLEVAMKTTVKKDRVGDMA